MGSLLSVTDSQYIPHWLRELQETGGLSGAHRCPGSPPSPSSTRRSTSAKGTWAKAPKRGWDLSLLRVRRGRGGRSAAQPIAAPVFEDERNRVGQAAARLDLCVTLAVCARDLRTVRDVPLAVAFEDRGEFISHRPFRFLTLHLDSLRLPTCQASITSPLGRLTRPAPSAGPPGRSPPPGAAGLPPGRSPTGAPARISRRYRNILPSGARCPE